MSDSPASSLASSAIQSFYNARYLVSAATCLYLIYRLVDRVIFTYRIRTRYKDIASLPRHWLWGNVVNCGERLGPQTGQHPDYGFESIWEELGQPQCCLLDFAPIDRGFLVVADPKVAEAITQPSPLYKNSLPKSDSYRTVRRLIGAKSFITQEDEQWKDLRRRFTPGFQPKYIHSLAPSIASQTRLFVQRLKAAAASGQVFKLRDYARDLTIDVLSESTIDFDLKAQSTPEGTGEKSLFGILTASRQLSQLTYNSGAGFKPLSWIDPIRPTKAWFYEQVFDWRLTAVVKQQFKTMDSLSEKAEAVKGRSIIQLSMAGLFPTRALIRSSVDQIKTFLFAGQDSTGAMIQWICYELSKASWDPHNASILAKLQDEHNRVFGEGAWTALDVLVKSHDAETILATKLPYTTAFVKEALRIHPPAATARMTYPAPSADKAPTVPINGIPTRIDGLRIYSCPWILQRNPAIWGEDAKIFKPDRWLDEKYMASLPPGAWRPFERGPRNCLGQELAMMEGKVVLAAVARGLEFEKVGLTGRMDETGQVEREVWSKYAVTSVPVDGMRMRVRVRGVEQI